MDEGLFEVMDKIQRKRAVKKSEFALLKKHCVFIFRKLKHYRDHDELFSLTLMRLINRSREVSPLFYHRQLRQEIIKALRTYYSQRGSYANQDFD